MNKEAIAEINKQKKQLVKEIALVKKFIDYIIEGYGSRPCTHKRKLDLHPDCKNCQTQWAVGWIRDHQSLLEWEMRELKKTERELVKQK